MEWEKLDTKTRGLFLRGIHFIGRIRKKYHLLKKPLYSIFQKLE